MYHSFLINSSADGDLCCFILAIINSDVMNTGVQGGLPGTFSAAQSRQASLSITNSRILFKVMSIELVMPSNNLIFCHPLLLLPPIPPSIRVFSN